MSKPSSRTPALAALALVPLYEVQPLIDTANRETSKATIAGLKHAELACLSLNPAMRP